MPSNRRQLNVRLSEEGEARLYALQARMRAALGIEVSLADVIHAALLELERRHPAADAAEPPPIPRAKPGRPRKADAKEPRT